MDNNAYMKIQIILIVAMAVQISGCQPKAFEIFDTKCGNVENPAGVTKERIVFSWKSASEETDITQSAYQILVSDDPGLLKSGEGNIWNSGRVVSDASLQIAFAGSASGYY